MKRLSVIAGGVGVVGMFVLAGYFLASNDSSEVPKEPTKDASVVVQSASETPQPKVQPESNNEQADALADKEPDPLTRFKEGLLAKYAGSLDQPKQRVRLLEEMMRFLIQMDPSTWRENLSLLIGEWFPDIADDLTAKAEAMIAYQQFMADQRAAMLTMNPDERRAFIWDHRRSLFGEDAEQIWAAELRNFEITRTLATLDEAPAPVDQKASQYRAAIQQAYGDSADTVLENRRQEFTDRFLGLSSVQSELQKQPAEQRYQALREIRETLGMPEDALERWDELDRVRDERWQTGQSYESQREQIVSNLPAGAEREAALDQLSQELFGNELGAIIRDEEDAGYFRFREPRVYGQN